MTVIKHVHKVDSEDTIHETSRICFRKNSRNRFNRSAHKVIFALETEERLGKVNVCAVARAYATCHAWDVAVQNIL